MTTNPVVTPFPVGPVDERQVASIQGSQNQQNAQFQTLINLINQNNAAASASIASLQAQVTAIGVTLTNDNSNLNSSLATVNASIASLQTQMAAVQAVNVTQGNQITVLQNAASPPAAPNPATGLTAGTITSTSIAVSWTAPASGPAVTSYTLQVSPTGQGVWTTASTGAGTLQTATGLTPITGYDFRVIGNDAAGPGNPSTVLSNVVTLQTTNAVTWQTVGATAALAFSNSNLTATATGSATPYAAPQGCVSTTSQSAGKFSFEVTLTQLTQNTVIGLGNAAWIATLQAGGTAPYIGDPNSIGLYPSTGAGSQPAQSFFFNNASIVTIVGSPAADSAGATFTCCVDITNALLWITGPAMRATYGTNAWNDSATANPATGVGGVPLSITGPVFIAFATAESGAVATINTGSSGAFHFAPPSTFPAWDGSAQSPTAPATLAGLASGTPTSTTIPLTWTQDTTGTPPITYQIQTSPHGAGTYTGSDTSVTGSGTATGLSPSTSYDVRVRAINLVNGLAGAFGSLTGGITTAAAPSVPGAPTIGAITNPTSASLQVNWSAPSTGGTPTGYQVATRANNTGSFVNFSPTAAAGATSQVVGGLTAATLYGAEVTAFNTTGSGVASGVATGTTSAANTGPGPTSTSAFMTANFTSLTGKTVNRELFGVSTATMLDFNFALMNNASFQAASLAANPPLLRFNCNSGSTGGPPWVNAFANGLTAPIITSVVAPLVNNLNKCVNLSTTKIIMGFGGESGAGGNSAMGGTPAQYAAAIKTAVQYLAVTPGSNGVPIDPLYWEIMNEWDNPGDDIGTSSTYNSYFNAAADAVHSVSSKYIICGPTSPDNFTELGSLISATNSTRMGVSDVHAYLYCPGSDPVPSALQVANAQTGGSGTTPGSFASSVNSTIAGTFAANLPFFWGEYNIGCGPNDGREQSMLGALYASSNLMQAVSACNTNLWGGLWEYGNSGGWGTFSGSTFTPDAQISFLSKAAATMPGSMVTCTPSGSLQAWATVNGGSFGVLVNNPTTSATSGQVALSHWPINANGTATVHVWTQTAGNTAGAVTTVAVTAGLTASINFPAQSNVIISP